MRWRQTSSEWLQPGLDAGRRARCGTGMWGHVPPVMSTWYRWRNPRWQEDMVQHSSLHAPFHHLSLVFGKPFRQLSDFSRSPRPGAPIMCGAVHHSLAWLHKVVLMASPVGLGLTCQWRQVFVQAQRFPGGKTPDGAAGPQKGHRSCARQPHAYGRCLQPRRHRQHGGGLRRACLGHERGRSRQLSDILAAVEAHQSGQGQDLQHRRRHQGLEPSVPTAAGFCELCRLRRPSPPTARLHS